MVSFHVLLLDAVGNNLVNADFSSYSRMFFAVKHIYLTLYIVHALRISPIYSVPPALPPCARVRVPVCACARGRAVRVPVLVCASADAWSTVDFFVRRPCVACLACPLSVCVRARACARVRGRCPPTFQSLAVHFIRL